MPGKKPGCAASWTALGLPTLGPPSPGNDGCSYGLGRCWLAVLFLAAKYMLTCTVKLGVARSRESTYRLHLRARPPEIQRVQHVPDCNGSLLVPQEPAQGVCSHPACCLQVKGLRAGRMWAFPQVNCFPSNVVHPEGNFFRMPWGSRLSPTSCRNVLHLWAWTTAPEGPQGGPRDPV